MRIALLRKKYTFHGGAEGFSQNFTQGLSKAGHEVHLFAIQWRTDREVENIFFHTVPALKFNSFFRDLTFALSSFFILKRKKKYFDIIQSHDKTLYQDIYRAGDGCHIEWLRQRWKRTGLLGKLSMVCNPYHWLILSLERIIFHGHRFKKVIAISELVKNNIIDHYNISEKDIVIIYNGVDLEKFHPHKRELYRDEIRQRYAIQEDSVVVLFVGSGFERKGLEYLIRAVELIDKPLTVMVVGKGNEEIVKRFIKGQRIIFCGPQQDIVRYYAASDMFVFPTIYEPFGNVHLEALASGLPVITTKLSGASEIIEDGVSGFIVSEPERCHEIAEKIKILMDESVRERMGKNARRLAENFSIENHIEKVVGLYKEVSLFS